MMACAAAILIAGCGRTAETESSSPPSNPAKPTAHATYAVEWVTHDIPATVAAGSRTPIHVNAKNTGDWAWPNAAAANPAHPDGSYAVRLSYRWTDPSGKPLPQGVERGELKASVPPGETVSFTMELVAPTQAGAYNLQFDLVEELVTFFSAKGAQKLTVPVTVQ